MVAARVACLEAPLVVTLAKLNGVLSVVIALGAVHTVFPQVYCGVNVEVYIQLRPCQVNRLIPDPPPNLAPLHDYTPPVVPAKVLGCAAACWDPERGRGATAHVGGTSQVGYPILRWWIWAHAVDVHDESSTRGLCELPSSFRLLSHTQGHTHHGITYISSPTATVPGTSTIPYTPK